MSSTESKVSKTKGTQDTKDGTGMFFVNEEVLTAHSVAPAGLLLVEDYAQSAGTHLNVVVWRMLHPVDVCRVL